jgi:hypothetical protein
VNVTAEGTFHDRIHPQIIAATCDDIEGANIGIIEWHFQRATELMQQRGNMAMQKSKVARSLLVGPAVAGRSKVPFGGKSR